MDDFRQWARRQTMIYKVIFFVGLLAILAVTVVGINFLIFPANTKFDDVEEEKVGYYSYVHSVEGSAVLVGPDCPPDGCGVEANSPLLPGYVLKVREGRVILYLSDGSVVTVEEGTRVVLEKIKGSPRSGDSLTVLNISRLH